LKHTHIYQFQDKELKNNIYGVYRTLEIPQFLANISNRKSIFSLVAAYSATVQIPGISGAGTTLELREFTATADVEILAHGKAHCLNGVPSNPTGAPGPSVITRAAFNLLPDLIYLPVDAGLKLKASAPGVIEIAGAHPADIITSGRSLGAVAKNAEILFEAGVKLGREIGQKYGADRYLVIGESVPGGTTTALGLLLALGLPAEERVSSSMPGNAHLIKLKAVNEGFAAIGRKKGDFRNNPLGGVAAVGDPMQAVVAGMALGASAFCPVMLGGGTQMAAVVALMAALKANNFYADLFQQANPVNIALATTRWVSADPTADLAGLAGSIEAELGEFPVSYLAANLNFSHSRYAPLQLYEQGYVKEGVGAGAAAVMAMLAANLSPESFLTHIEKVYESIVLGM
jgi:uncharacterized protein (TIGR00303 family)